MRIDKEERDSCVEGASRAHGKYVRAARRLRKKRMGGRVGRDRESGSQHGMLDGVFEGIFKP